MSGTITTPAPGDTEYAEYVAHPDDCAACKAGGDPCPTALELGRAWREARR